MSVDLSNISSFVHQETVKAIREMLESHMGEDNAERRRQDRLAAAIKKKGLQAEDDPADVEEAEDETEEEPKTQDTGVPGPEDEPSREDRTGGKGTADSPKLATPSERQIGNVSTKSVIDKLNALRGGKSLEDPGVRKSFDQYFKSLAHQERESLLVYITALAQILAGVVKGGEAIDPGDVGLRVKGDVEHGEEAKDKRKETTKDDRKRVAAKPGSAAMPIVVGEGQQKRNVHRILEAYKKMS